MSHNPNEYYGTVEGMPESILRERFNKANSDAGEYLAELNRRASFTSTEKLADRLHKLLHFGVDCDFYYSNWPNSTGCRSDFYVLAGQMEKWWASAIKYGDKDNPLGGLVGLMEHARFGSGA